MFLFTRFNPILEKLSQRQDVILAIFIVSVIFMLILPLPTQLVDALIAFNISIAVILLMVAVYLGSPLDFSSFPAVLLITTLFRLALSISTTRLILLQGDAGQIVSAFGNFVVGGNLVVGLVIFLILTIVQFIVITKGAERVAEVSARFSLDALPGKQLSIDADMRAGAITLEQAREMRARIQQESKLYGSMDGAMKFVKGDAIASVIIVFVNLLGGLGIGILQRGLSFSEAIHIYSILSIGDGLIAQIPALFISITAGIMVTRVSDGTSDANLGRDIGRQIGAQPRALLIASAMLVVMAFLPGFPSLIFLSLAGVLGVPALIGTLMLRNKVDWEDEEVQSSAPVAPDRPVGGQKFSAARDPIFAPTLPALVELPSAVLSLAPPHEMRDQINQARLTLYYRLGTPLPVIEARVNPTLENNQYKIFIGEIPAADGMVDPACVFVMDKAENLDVFKIPYRVGADFLSNHKTLWVEQAHISRLEGSGFAYKKPLELIQYHCETVLAKYASSFIGIQETKFLLSRMEESAPDLVKEAQRALPIQTIAELFRRLVQEYVSIRDLRQILSAIIEWGAKEKDPILLVEHIRSSLSRQISYQYSVGYNILPAFLLDSEIEETVRNGVRQTSVASYIALDPEIAKKIVAGIKSMVGAALEGDNLPVLITAMDIRRYVRRLIEIDLPEIPVLSHQEITSEITLQPLGRVTI